MKKSSILLIVWSAIAVLIVVVAVVLFTGSSIYYKNKYPSEGESYSYELRYSDSKRYTVGGSQLSGIEDIEIDWASGLISIEQYDGDLVKFFETSDFGISENDSMYWLKDGTTLKIKFRKSGLQLINVLDKKLTIQVPYGYALKKIEIDSASAKIKIDGICVDELEMDGASGYAVISAASGRKLDFKSASGALRGTELRFDEIEAETVSGEVSLALAEGCVPKKYKVKTVSGNVALQLSSVPGFTVDFESVSGDINCEVPVRMSNKRAVVFGDGSMLAEVETVSGDLLIN